jgi:DNA topoisomerase I
MRTDSVNLSDEARKKAGEMILKNYGKEYHTPRNYKTKSAGAQEAHEAIRPVDFNRTPESVASYLEPQEKKLYELIWKRALASQMSEAIVETTSFSFSPQEKDQSWSVNGEVIQFDGFMKLYIESLDDEENETEDGGILPNLKK